MRLLERTGDAERSAAVNLYNVADHDARIAALHRQGGTPLEIAVTMSDVMVGFSRPSEGFVKARLRVLGLQPNRTQRALRYGKCDTRAKRRGRKPRKGTLPAAA